MRFGTDDTGRSTTAAGMAGQAGMGRGARRRIEEVEVVLVLHRVL